MKKHIQNLIRTGGMFAVMLMVGIALQGCGEDNGILSPTAELSDRQMNDGAMAEISSMDPAASPCGVTHTAIIEFQSGESNATFSVFVNAKPYGILSPKSTLKVTVQEGTVLWTLVPQEILKPEITGKLFAESCKLYTIRVPKDSAELPVHEVMQ